MFPFEEQDIPSKVEPIMQSLRRIMYHVLNYHLDKATKLVQKIGHIMVNRHSNFTESRGFCMTPLRMAREILLTISKISGLGRYFQC